MDDYKKKIEDAKNDIYLQQRTSTIRSILTIFSRGITRNANRGDPTIRAMLLFDKLCLCVDIITVGVISGNYDLPDDIKNEIINASAELNAELDYVFNYILDPQYTSDNCVYTPNNYFDTVEKYQPSPYVDEVVENQREKEQREEEERKLQQRIATIKSVLVVFSRGLGRHINCGDAMIRSTLLFDKLCLCVDIINIAIITCNHDLPDDIKKEITKTSAELNSELDYVFNYILSPRYSPDHPYGNKIMRTSEKHFNDTTKTSVVDI